MLNIPVSMAIFPTVFIIIIIIIIESLLSHKINNHISYVTTLKEGMYIN